MTILFHCLVTMAQSEISTQRAEDITRKTFEDSDLPGLAVAVSKADEWVWTGSYGYANTANSTLIDPNTSLFRIGSVSKTYTAIGLLELYQGGKIDLDADIHDYIPEFFKSDPPPTVRQIAQHTGGIRHYRDGEFLNNTHYSTVKEGLVIFINDPLKFEPGSKFSYSSYGWNLISAAMEVASGKEFLSFMQNNVFLPAGMKSTLPDDASKEITNRVSFYEKSGIISPLVDNSYKWASGGFLSTVADLIRFGTAVLDNSLISAETLHEAIQTSTLEDGEQTRYGIGFEIGTDNKGRPWIGHGGGSVGGTTMFIIYPEEELIIAVLTNQSSAKIRKLAFNLADEFIKEQ
jgi:CubicO group peptidase (beta-lactamase class C family)